MSESNFYIFFKSKVGLLHIYIETVVAKQHKRVTGNATVVGGSIPTRGNETVNIFILVEFRSALCLRNLTERGELKCLMDHGVFE